jgi:hypothetical protein
MISAAAIMSARPWFITCASRSCSIGVIPSGTRSIKLNIKRNPENYLKYHICKYKKQERELNISIECEIFIKPTFLGLLEAIFMMHLLTINKQKSGFIKCH